MKGHVKEAWGNVTDDDLQKLDGKKDQISGLLQERYGWAKEDADNKLDEWTGKFNTLSGKQPAGGN
jgi:uncharacterized protein YjbJ (UPF0337 family)